MKKAHKHPVIIAHYRECMNGVWFDLKCNTDALNGTLFIVKTTTPMPLGWAEFMG